MNKEIGFDSESAVLDYLEQNGYRLLVRNFEIHNVGELDLVMVKGDDVYVIEVKSRLVTNVNKWGDPEFAINSNKLRKMKNTVKYLVAKYDLYDSNIIFMAGSVLHDKNGRILNIRVFEI